MTTAEHLLAPQVLADIRCLKSVMPAHSPPLLGHAPAPCREDDQPPMMNPLDEEPTMGNTELDIAKHEDPHVADMPKNSSDPGAGNLLHARNSSALARLQKVRPSFCRYLRKYRATVDALSQRSISVERLLHFYHEVVVKTFNMDTSTTTDQVVQEMLLY
jgi:hypothetical protein